MADQRENADLYGYIKLNRENFVIFVETPLLHSSNLIKTESPW